MRVNESDCYCFGATGGSSSIQGQMDIVLTLPLLFLMTVIFMNSLLGALQARAIVGERIGYRMLSTTTSTSQGRSVPFFFGLFGFLFFISSPRVVSVFRLSSSAYALAISRAAASCAMVISPASKLGL